MFTYGDGAPEIITLLRDEIDDTQESPNGAFPDGRNFSDERLTEMLVQEGQNLGRFLARCCEILARAYARYPTATRLGPTDETVNAFEHYTTEASRLRRLHGYVNSRKDGTAVITTEVRP